MIERSPDLYFRVQSVKIPGISSNHVTRGTMYNKLLDVGDEVDFDPLVIGFKIDENFVSWKSMFDWIVGSNEVVDSTSYAQMKSQDPFLGKGITSNINLFVMNSVLDTNVYFTFYSAFPTALGPVQLGTTNSVVDYADCFVTFSYDRFEINRV